MSLGHLGSVYQFQRVRVEGVVSQAYVETYPSSKALYPILSSLADVTNNHILSIMVVHMNRMEQVSTGVASFTTPLDWSSCDKENKMCILCTCH